tara:strand:- start:279 stop:542 length:264 start_codon:yes stop_codon:yes gene_type:complete
MNMSGPTGKLKHAYQTIANMEAKINELKEKLASSISFADIELMKEKAIDEMQSSYDSEMYNASGDSPGTPLIDLESAKCAIEHIETK